MGTITEELFSRRLGHAVHAGDTVVAEVDVAMAHDVTGPLAIEAFRSLDLPLWDASRIVFNFDHVMPANTVAAAELHRVIREFCVEHGITNLFAEGICHQVMVDRRLARPGGIVVGADSHSTTYGGLGCFATGLGSTDIGVVFATGKTWFRIPETVRVEVHGSLPRGVAAKDLALHVIAQMGADGADYCAVEWGGDAVAAMSVDERLTLCNLSTDFGAKTGIIEPDAVTVAHSGGEPVDLHPIHPHYVRTLVVDAERLRPQIAVHPSIDNVHDIDDVAGTSLDEVFIGSCTNGRIEDLEAAARVLKGRKVASGVHLLIVPGSQQVKIAAEAAGLADIFKAAGADWRESGCSMCLGMNGDTVGAGKYALSTSNRNFEGRQGVGARTLLASPYTAAASAIAGKISDPRSVL